MTQYKFKKETNTIREVESMKCPSHSDIEMFILGHDKPNVIEWETHEKVNY